MRKDEIKQMFSLLKLPENRITHWMMMISAQQNCF